MQTPNKLKALTVTMVVLCLLGAWISGALVKDQAGPWPSLNTSPTVFTGLCGSTPDGASGCAAVLKSDWSAIDFSVPVLTSGLTIEWSRVVLPVAFIGLAYYVFLGVWFAFAGPPRSWGRRWHLVPLLTVLGGAMGSIALFWVMIFELEARCWWCMVAHGINGLLLIGTLCLWPRKAVLAAEQTGEFDSRGYPGRRNRVAWAPWKTIGFAVLLIAGLWTYRGAKLEIRRQAAKLLPYKRFVEKLQRNPAFLVGEYYAQPQRVIPSRTANGRTAGGGPEPTLVVFSDFQCPHCACFAGNWKNHLRGHWKGPLSVSFRHFPLGRECNDTLTRGIHPAACQAGYAAEAARLQGGEEAFWKMHDRLFSQGRSLGQGRYTELAVQIGLDAERFVADMQGEAVRQAVVADVALAAELGVSGTPTVFLNGRLVPQLCLQNPIFWEAICGELSPSSSVAAVGRTGNGAVNHLGHAEPVVSTQKVSP